MSVLSGVEGGEHTLASDSIHRGRSGALQKLQRSARSLILLSLPQMSPQIWSRHWDRSVGQSLAQNRPALTQETSSTWTWQSPLRCPVNLSQTSGVLATKNGMPGLFRDP